MQRKLKVVGISTENNQETLDNDVVAEIPNEEKHIGNEPVETALDSSFTVVFSSADCEDLYRVSGLLPLFSTTSNLNVLVKELISICFMY